MVFVTWTERAADTGEKNLVCGLALGKACSGEAQCEPLLALTGDARVSVGIPGRSVLIDLTTVLTVGGGRHQDNRERGRWRERRGHWNLQVSWKYKKQTYKFLVCSGNSFGLLRKEEGIRTWTDGAASVGKILRVFTLYVAASGHTENLSVGAEAGGAGVTVATPALSFFVCLSVLHALGSGRLGSSNRDAGGAALAEIED